MSKRTDLTNRKVGHLTVTRPAPSRKGNTYWYCTCACGRECIQPKSALISNPPKVKSCGCQKEDYLDRGEWGEIYWKVFTFLRTIAYFPKSKQSSLDKRHAFWLCFCDGGGTGCGRIVRATTTDLKKGRVISCTVCRDKAEQTLSEEIIDDILNNTRRKHLTRASYDAMLGRPRHAKTYRNISICPQWKGVNGFEQFIKDVGLRPHGGMSLERKDPSQSYSPANCIWADDRTQRRNKTNSVRYNVNGGVMNLADLATAVDSTSRKLRQRLDRMVASGFTPDQAAERILAEHHSNCTLCS